MTKEYCSCGYQYNGITFYYGKCCKRCGKELKLIIDSDLKDKVNTAIKQSEDKK